MCPVGRAWIDYPSAPNTAHADGVECSNMGICNRVSGLCECRSGFVGQACDRCENTIAFAESIAAIIAAAF